MEVPEYALKDLTTFNGFLMNRGAGEEGNHAIKKLYDSNANYTTATYIEGDFSKTYEYYAEEYKNAKIKIKVKEKKQEVSEDENIVIYDLSYVNKKYNFFSTTVCRNLMKDLVGEHYQMEQALKVLQ